MPVGSAKLIRNGPSFILPTNKIFEINRLILVFAYISRLYSYSPYIKTLP